MMRSVTLLDELDRPVEQPTVDGILQKAENKKTKQEGQKHLDDMDIIVSQPFKDQYNT